MIRRTQELGPAARAGYDAIIDVRSPAEFALDHLPGSINLPVLDDAERAEIGTIYVQRSKFLARRLGAAKVARNIAHHLDGALAGRDSSFRPLVYCWRGGQRSGAMATVMAQVGWPVTVIEGGYQSWRRQVVARLYSQPSPDLALRVILLDGRTGSGKTQVLDSLARHGFQTLDLEGLADHRGSLFGATAAPQPSQKAFESRLIARLEQIDPTRPLFVEAESSRIGDVTLPPALWSDMRRAPRVTLMAPLDARAEHIMQVYGDIAADGAALEAALCRLPRQHGRETVARWRALAASGETATLVSELMQAHYDPAYDRCAGQRGQVSLGTVPITLSAAGIDEAARRVAALAGACGTDHALERSLMEFRPARDTAEGDLGADEIGPPR